MTLVMSGGKIVFQGGVAASVTSTTSNNPMGLNYPVGGAGALDYMALPLFQNHVHSARGFTDTSTGTNPITTDASGWPTVDFRCQLCEFSGSSIPSWVQVNGSPAWACGYTSKNSGAETLTASNATISNKVINGNLVTFDLTPTAGAFYFQLTGTTGGVTNVFANLPAYRNCTTPFTSGVDTYTTEAINLYKQIGHIRFMQWSNAGNNNQSNTSSTMRTWSNTQTNMGWATSGSAAFHGEGYPLQWALDFCVKCNIGIWYNLPPDDDGTYRSAVATAIKNTLPAGLPVIIEFCNEIWNNGFAAIEFYNLTAAYILANPGVLDYDSSRRFTGSTTINSNVLVTDSAPPAGFTAGHYLSGPGIPTDTKLNSVAGNNLTLSNNATSTQASGTTYAFEDFTTQHRYLAVSYKAIYDTFLSVYGAGRIGVDVFICPAWQTGGNGLSACTHFFDFQNRLYSGSFAQYWAIAPYYTRDNTSVPGDGVNYRGNSDSIALIEAELGRKVPYEAYFSKAESIAITAMHYNANLVAYEGCWDSFSNESAATNVGATIEDSGYSTVESNYYQYMFNSGFVRFTRFEGGSYSNGAGTNLGAQFTLTSSYATVIANTAPRWTAMTGYFSGLPTATRNLVSGSGSVISSINYMDNVTALSATLPNMGGSSFSAYSAPYNGIKGGTCGWIVNCSAAGTYSLAVNFTTTQSGVTDVEVNGTIVATSVAISNSLTDSPVTLSNVTLKKGVNYLVLGKAGTTQAGITFSSNLTFT